MKKLKKQYSGGWVDESVSDRTRAMILAMPGGSEDLIEEFARLIGRFRSWRELRESEPQPEVVIQHLQKTKDLVCELQDCMDRMPLMVQAYGNDIGRCWNEGYVGMERALLDNLIKFQVLLPAIAKRFQPQRGHRGERPKTLERLLLADVDQLFERSGCDLGVIERAQRVFQILNDAGVHGLPSDGAKARKVILAVRKAQQGPEIRRDPS